MFHYQALRAGQLLSAARQQGGLSSAALRLRNAGAGAAHTAFNTPRRGHRRRGPPALEGSGQTQQCWRSRRSCDLRSVCKTSRLNQSASHSGCLHGYSLPPARNLSSKPRCVVKLKGLDGITDGSDRGCRRRLSPSPQTLDVVTGLLISPADSPDPDRHRQFKGSEAVGPICQTPRKQIRFHVRTGMWTGGHQSEQRSAEPHVHQV